MSRRRIRVAMRARRVRRRRTAEGRAAKRERRGRRRGISRGVATKDARLKSRVGGGGRAGYSAIPFVRCSLLQGRIGTAVGMGFEDDIGRGLCLSVRLVQNETKGYIKETAG